MQEEVNPRLLQSGDIVSTEWGDQVVRDVFIIVRLANGADWVVDASSKVTRTMPEPVLSEEELQTLSSILGESAPPVHTGGQEPPSEMQP